MDIECDFFETLNMHRVEYAVFSFWRSLDIFKSENFSKIWFVCVDDNNADLFMDVTSRINVEVDEMEWWLNEVDDIMESGGRVDVEIVKSAVVKDEKSKLLESESSGISNVAANVEESESLLSKVIMERILVIWAEGKWLSCIYYLALLNECMIKLSIPKALIRANPMHFGNYFWNQMI